MPVKVVCRADSIRDVSLADSAFCLTLVHVIEMCPDFAAFPVVTHFIFFLTFSIRSCPSALFSLASDSSLSRCCDQLCV